MRASFFSLLYNSLIIFVLLSCQHHYRIGCEAQEGSKVNSDLKDKRVDTSNGGLYTSGDKLLYLFEYDFKLCHGVRNLLNYSLVLQVRNVFSEPKLYMLNCFFFAQSILRDWYDMFIAVICKWDYS